MKVLFILFFRLIASREGGGPISLDRRQLGMLREEVKTMYHGNIKERVVTFRKQDYVLYHGLAILTYK